MDFSKNALLISILGLVSVFAEAKLPSKKIKAEVVGESLAANRSEVFITLNNKKCTVKSTGENPVEGQPPKTFKIELTCASRTQVLWDITKPEKDELTFDEPMFRVVWAGDMDGDDKIDLEVDLSPKYSCSKVATFLSTKADKTQIVGLDKKTESCGQ